MQEFREESVWRGNPRVEMLLRNEVRGVLPIHRENAPGKEGLVYDTSGFLSLEEWGRTKVLGERELRWVLGGMLTALSEGEAYLLQPESYFLDPEHVFVKPAKEEVRLCVRPEGEGDWTGELRETGRFMLEAIDYKDEDSVKLAYEFYHVSKREQVRPEDCRAVLQTKVFTIITEDGEQAERFVKVEPLATETIAIGQSASWICIEADTVESRALAAKEKERKEARKKKWFRIGISVGAVLLLLVVLWQSGF